MNPILIGLLGCTLAFAGGTWYGTGLGEDREYAKRAREEAIVAKAVEGSEKAAAKAIAANKPIYTTIKQQATYEHTTERIYSDCKLPASGVQRINAAINETLPVGAGGVVVPEASGAAAKP